MSKRTQTDNALTRPKDFWRTPLSALMPLVPHLPPATRFVEPCAGDGAISNGLGLLGHVCEFAFDIEPRAPGIVALDATYVPVDGKLVITNPPFRWSLLRPLLDHWIGSCDAWLLLPWDMTCNARFSPYAQHVDRMLPIGRVSWLDNGQGGFENYGWFHFTTARQGLILPR